MYIYINNVHDPRHCWHRQWRDERCVVLGDFEADLYYSPCPDPAPSSEMTFSH